MIFFCSTKSRTAFGKLLSPSGGGLEPVVVSDEEQFSVDAFVFTDRESKRTPLCFYYDKNLHSNEYRLATNGKVKMQIELRASGRDIFNQIDLYSERKAFRPFRLGFVKEEQDGGRGDVYGEGLYTAGDNVKLTADPFIGEGLPTEALNPPAPPPPPLICPPAPPPATTK